MNTELRSSLDSETRLLQTFTSAVYTEITLNHFTSIFYKVLVSGSLDFVTVTVFRKIYLLYEKAFRWEFRKAGEYYINIKIFGI